jgi:hypothetical protein
MNPAAFLFLDGETEASSSTKTGHFLGPLDQIPRVPADTPLDKGDDAETDACLNWFNFDETDCVDVAIIFWYSLESQPTTPEKETRRFVAYKGPNEEFEWLPVTKEENTTYCAKYYKGPNFKPPIDPGVQ